MDSEKKLNIAIGVALFLVIFCIIWDWGTPDPIQAITLNPLNTDWSVANFNINSIIQTILSALIGFLLSILVIESVINKQRKQEEEIALKRKAAEDTEKSNSRLNTIIDLLRYPIVEYARATKIITNIARPKENNYLSGGYPNISIPITKDALLDIYNYCMYPDKSTDVKKIDVYIESVRNLRTAITNILLNGDFYNYPELAQHFSGYLNDTYYAYVLSKTLISQKKKYKQNLEKIGSDLDKPIEDNPSNSLAIPFFNLKILIDKHDIFFQKLLNKDEYNFLFM